MSKTINIPDVYGDMIDCLRNDELFFYHKKADVADSFTIVAESHGLDSLDKDKLRNCLSLLSRLLDAIAVSKKEEDIDAVIESRIITSFKLWHCVTDLEETIKVLQRIVSYCKDEDKEALSGAISLLIEFDKDIKRPVENEQ